MGSGATIVTEFKQLFKFQDWQSCSVHLETLYTASIRLQFCDICC